MQYTLILTSQEIEIIAKIMREGPYRIVRPIIDNIASQIEQQNKSLVDKKE